MIIKALQGLKVLCFCNLSGFGNWSDLVEWMKLFAESSAFVEHFQNLVFSIPSQPLQG